MAFDKNSNTFTFAFATIMVILVGVILASVSMALKPRQQENAANKKRIDILKAIGVPADRKDAKDKFNQYIVERVAFNAKGEVVEKMTGDIDPQNKRDPFNIDIKKEYKNKIKKVMKKCKGDKATCYNALSKIDTKYPIFKAVKNDSTFYIIPCAGTGLWGPIWGYVALMDDAETIYGAVFDHEGETPGLGAEIKQPTFQAKFKGKKIDLKGEKSFEVIKSGKPDNIHSIQGITGGTITSRGVGAMLDRTFTTYKKYLDTIRK